MSELDRAIALLIQLELGADDEATEEIKDELTALLFTLNQRRTGHPPYHKTYRGAHALEQMRAIEEGREPILIPHDEFLRSL